MGMDTGKECILLVMKVIFLDGESKSGKTAVGRAIRQALQDDGYTVRLLVAGHFFRHLTLLALQRRPDKAGLVGDWLEAALHDVLTTDQLYKPVEDVTALHTPEVDAAVSAVGQFDFVQHAATDWRVKSAQRTLDDGVDIMLFDGRNLRSKLTDWSKEHDVTVALELIIACRAGVAAARYLSDEGVAEPSAEQLAGATKMIEDRREMDRQRNQAAYSEPADAVKLVVGSDSVDEALTKAWELGTDNPPRPVRFDNSEVPRDDGLRTVTDIARKAVKRLQA